MWSGMITVNELLPQESEMESYPTPPSSVMSTHSTVKGTPQHIREWLTLLPEDSPVSLSASPESAKDLQTSATDGPQQWSACASFDPATHSWRTFQASFLLDTSEPFSETWPKAGSIADGVFYPQPKWERRISGIGFGLWPTPAAHDAADRTQFNPIETSNGTIRHLNKAGSQSRASLSQIVKMLPTPTSRDWRSGTGAQAREGHAPPLTDVVGGQLNPPWVEWLMGWPLGWTDLQPLAMDKFRQWLEQHGC
jgi:hypothetical protein